MGDRDGVLAPLRNLANERPTTKMGQIRWAWAEIEAAMAAGHTLQTIHKRLGEIGVVIDYKTLSLYLGRLAREKGRRPPKKQPAPPQGEKRELARGPDPEQARGLEAEAARVRSSKLMKMPATADKEDFI